MARRTVGLELLDEGAVPDSEPANSPERQQDFAKPGAQPRRIAGPRSNRSVCGIFGQGVFSLGPASRRLHTAKRGQWQARRPNRSSFPRESGKSQRAAVA